MKITIKNHRSIDNFTVVQQSDLSFFILLLFSDREGEEKNIIKSFDNK